MLKKRIIPLQLLLNGRLVKPTRFDSYRDVGDPVSSSKVYNSQFADELIFLNIDREVHSIEPLLNVLEAVTEECFMPLSLGGGIRSYDDAATLIKSGADKVVLNSIAYREPEVINKVKTQFGAQAVVVCIDVRLDKKNNEYQLYSHCGQNKEPITLDEHLQCVVNAGAGEILIQAIDHDGTMAGFDVPLVKRVNDFCDLPVIACGGSGNYEHLKEVFIETNVSAVACGSIFNFSDSNLIRAKSFLSNYDLPFKEI